MFDFLKKKITDFTDKLKGAIQKKEPTPEQQKPAEQPKKTPEKPQKLAPQQEAIEEQKETISQEYLEDEALDEVEPEAIPQKEMEEEFDAAGEKKKTEEKIKEVRGEEKRELKAKVGIVKKLFGFVGGKIKISEKETGEFFEEFELSLLESDVEQDTAHAITEELKTRLIGKELSAKEDVTKFLKQEVKESLEKIMETKQINIFKMKQKPLKILFLGPNGAGKTTSIAKIAKRFMDNGKTVLIAAGDTFRAASIEQLEEHARRIGVKVIKHKYGADPAAVAFDAVKAAEAKKMDAVLIDTAGRQDTNKNLIEELKKIERVVKPDLKLYVGEAYTGQALLEQVSQFDEAIGIDGFVLTKIDTDTKGGTAISLLHKFKKPIVFVGTGQRYGDLLEFKPEFITNRIM